MKTTAVRMLTFAAPVALAIAVFAYVTTSREPPKQSDMSERASAVRVVEVAPTAFAPTIAGFGSVEPINTWSAVAQVQGRIEYVHPNLRVGAFINAGEEIIRIAPEEYDLAVQEAEATLNAEKARLQELETRAATTKLSLDLETRSLELKRKDLERVKRLLTRGVASQSTVDDVEREVLQQEVKVQDLKSGLDIYQAEIETQNAQIAVAEAKVKSAKLDLARTRIAMPFRGRVSSKDVERTQFVTAGTKLASASDASAAEITASMPQGQFGQFIRLSVPPDVRRRIVRNEADRPTPESLGLTASVAIASATFDRRWPARLQRTTDTIDAANRSVGVIVTVDDPYGTKTPGSGPPLAPGMFVRVELRGKALEDAKVVPRAAVRNGRVYVANAENRLEIRPVEVTTFQGDDALIAEGLDFGDRIVVSDLSPAIEGMLLAPMADPRPDADAEAPGEGAAE